VRELEEYGIKPLVVDPEADAEEAKRLYGLGLSRMEDLRGMDAVVIAVAHDAFKTLSTESLESLYGTGKRVLVDVKAILDKDEMIQKGYVYWRL
jgi:UDP-N-acetyl-D-galactosamine dehydrogenase